MDYAVYNPDQPTKEFLLRIADDGSEEVLPAVECEVEVELEVELEEQMQEESRQDRLDEESQEEPMEETPRQEEPLLSVRV